MISNSRKVSSSNPGRLSGIFLSLMLGSVLLMNGLMGREPFKDREERAKARAKYEEAQAKVDAKAVEEAEKARAKEIEERAKGKPKWIEEREKARAKAIEEQGKAGAKWIEEAGKARAKALENRAKNFNR